MNIYTKGLIVSLLGRRTSAITLAPFGIFIKGSRWPDATLLNHELIHWDQQLEMWILPFYIWYVAEWIVKGLRYSSISFEREAWDNEHNHEYRSSRKRFAWLRYLNKRQGMKWQ